MKLSDLWKSLESGSYPRPPLLTRAHSYSRNGLHHGQAHHDRAGGVVVPVVRQPTDTVVAVSQDLDS